jgi:RES domain-containing protein
MPKAYRIVKTKFAESAFDGEGARLFGGRWNGKGVRMVYTSASASLAALETFVHMGIDARTLPHLLIEIDIPEEIIEAVSELPSSWKENPAPESCQEFGNEWANSKRSAVLRVPSVVMEMENNYLLNPAHPDFDRITIQHGVSFTFDERMWKVGN